MENFETTANIDELFDLWKSNYEEIKRKVLGKYTKETETFNIEDKIYTYRGVDICNHKFNYLLPGNRCKMCSSLHLLKDADDISDEHIHIEHGKNKGKNISIECHQLEKHFGQYKYSNISSIDILSNLPPCNFFMNDFYVPIISFIANTNMGHEVVMSSLFHEFGIKNRFLCAYMCNKLRIVKIVPSFIGTLDGLTISLDFVINIIQTISDVCSTTNVIHGCNSMEFLSFDVIKSKLITYIDPSPKTSFSNEGYHQRHILLNSKNHVTNYKLSNVPCGCLFTRNEKFNNFDEDIKPISPTLEIEGLYYFEYVTSSEELFNFVERTEMNVFKPFEFYIWMIVLLCEKKLFDLIPDDFLEYLFYGEDLVNVKTECVKQHNLKTSYEDVKNIMIRLSIKMRHDILKIIDEVINFI